MRREEVGAVIPGQMLARSRWMELVAQRPAVSLVTIIDDDYDDDDDDGNKRAKNERGKIGAQVSAFKMAHDACRGHRRRRLYSALMALMLLELLHKLLP